ncbi:MAG: aldose epimerase family protein [Oscillospiraceae bacterium]
MKLQKNLYGTTQKGNEVYSFIITNKSGAYIELLSFGATLNKIVVPDKDGNFADVLMGFDTMEGIENGSDSEGRTVGRVANRISGSGITIDGKNYPITKNIDGKFTLHGNHEYSKAIWNFETIGDNAVKFSYFSADGNEGFPANVENEVTFSFNDDNEVKIDYLSQPDAKTAINITNHSYFNLGGYDSGDILNHELQIFADAFTPMNEDSIPTGEIRPVSGTVFDFNTPKTIGRDVNADDEQLKIGIGYDHNFKLLNYNGKVREFAKVKEPKTGREMTCYTDLPGVQLYIANYKDGTQIGKGGKPQNYRNAFCLETQYFPDALNNKNFIQCVFDENNPFKSTTIFKFSK